MPHDALRFHKALHHIFEGLRAGLTRFSGPSRVALLYALSRQGDAHIYDPLDLLRGHEPKLLELYGTPPWPGCGTAAALDGFFPCPDPELSGIIAFGARSPQLPLQVWFTEHHPDMCSTEPTVRWLEEACRLMTQTLQHPDQSLESAGFVLQEFALHAVRDAIVDNGT